MQKIKQDNTTVIIRDESVEVNGVLFVKKEVAEPEKPIHPFLRDVPEVTERAYTLTSSQASPIGQVFQCEIDRGTASLNRDALVELDNRRLALTALRRWIGENNVPVATEEQMADGNVRKYSPIFDYEVGSVWYTFWFNDRSVGDIHFLSKSDARKVRDNCDALIRNAYGWPEVKSLSHLGQLHICSKRRSANKA